MYCSTLHRKRRMSFSHRHSLSIAGSFSLSLSQECQEGCYPSNPRIVQHSERAKMQHDVWPSLWSLLKDQTSPRQISGVFCSLAVQQMCPHCAPENLDQASNRLKRLSGFVSQIHKVHNKRSKQQTQRQLAEPTDLDGVTNNCYLKQTMNQLDASDSL